MRLVAAGVLLGLATFQSAALAQEEDDRCDFEESEADAEGCLTQDGDNASGAEDDFAGTGGDGVGGSNVIGAAGSGRTRIRADNTSEFSDAEGGSTESKSETVIDNGPSLEVEAGNRSVTAIATGVSSVRQVATPTVEITLDQVASATGASTVSNAVTSATTLTGSNVLGQSGTGAGPVTQTLTQTGTSSVTNTFAPVITTIATNDATISASAPVNQSATAISNPTATAIVGPGVSGAASATGSAVVAQSATPDTSVALGQSASATGPSIFNAAAVSTTLDALNSATGRPVGPVVQTINQNATGGSAVLDALNRIVAGGSGTAPITPPSTAQPPLLDAARRRDIS
jgi:hypothetical protein